MSGKIDMPAKEMLPKHVGIIMDGNGRWAKKRLLPRVAGHKAGAETVKKIVKFASDSGIEALTLYAFSTENWSRPDDEVSALMSLILEYLTRELDEMHKNGVIIRTVGDKSRMPKAVRDMLDSSSEKTKDNKGMVLNLALNYGSRAEIVSAVKKIAEKVKNNEIDVDDIDESMVSSNLYTCDVPDPDIIIRTSGEQRLSNFLLYQAAYSEFYFTDVYWPDFKEKEFAQAMHEYLNRKRRFGGI